MSLIISLGELFELVAKELTWQGAVVTEYDEDRGLFNVAFEGKNELISQGHLAQQAGLIFGNEGDIKEFCSRFIANMDPNELITYPETSGTIESEFA